MSDIERMQQETQVFQQLLTQVRDAVGQVIVGQTRVVEAVITAMVCGGNVLLEGVPGLGKTQLVKTLGAALDLNYNRIQFTPDLMPADVVGTNILTSDDAGGSSGNYRLEFRQGPVFTQLLLADEINRATPKTQAAMLEVMQEHSVTVGGNTYKMKEPYFVLATQNPIEQEGTYPLPEAQLDRFLFKVTVPFPTRQELNDIVTRTILKQALEVPKVLNSEKIMAMRNLLNKVVVADAMRDYAIRLVLATHPDSEFATDAVKKYVRWGASPRAGQGLILAARVRALSEGRPHVAFEDIRYFAEEILQHRTLLNYDGQAENVVSAKLIKQLTEQVPETV
ncbi:MAG TPA: AAA family ATPase [Phycisphaerales bacterium]|nr:AAA family ATPase [Phycisphaerales bacterium]HCD31938.1 AAA family ATPase [Phycisphaerales bacterium]|tara:strand:+ start:16009 stop:17019 length:1011 start_codon:yes stop_codon:yes gene_type:complete